jgi:stress response protein YsnF
MSDETRRIEEVVIPLAEESASVSKREVETGQVRVALSTDIETVVAREMLRGCKIEIERCHSTKRFQMANLCHKVDRRVTHSSSPLLRNRLWW